MNAIKHLVFLVLMAVPLQVLADSCGSVGQKVCYVWDKDWKAHPFGCDQNLVADRGGVCRRPACGRDRENRCALSVRALPCDWGLVLNPKDGKCYTGKEIGDALAKKAAEDLCKTTLSHVRARKIPPLLANVADSLRKRAQEVQPVAARYDEAAKAFAGRNKQNYEEIRRIGTSLKNDPKRLAAVKTYLLSDDICVAKSFDARVADLRRMGVFPNLQDVKLSNSDSNFGIIPSAHAQGDRSAVLTILWQTSLAAGVAGQLASGLSIDFTRKHVGPVVAFAIGGKTNIKYTEGNSISFVSAPSHDFASGRGYQVGGGVGEIIGVGGGVIFNDEVGAVGGILDIGLDLGLSPADVGVMVEWHAVLLPKGLGGAL